MKTKVRQFAVAYPELAELGLCITCEDLGYTCKGSSLSAMNVEQRSNWCRLRKEYLGITNEDISQGTKISIKTVANFLAGNVDDVKLTTSHTIMSYLCSDFQGVCPCLKQMITDTADAPHPLNAHKIQTLERDIARLEKQLADSALESQKKIDFLRAELEKKSDAVRKKDSIIEKKDDIIEKKDSIIEKKDDIIEKKDAIIEKKDDIIEKKDAIIEKLMSR